MRCSGLSVSPIYCWQHTVSGTPQAVTCWRGKKKNTRGGPEACHCTQCCCKAQMLPGCLFTQEDGTCNIGKKAFQILCCGKWFLTDFLILCLNLCCLALTVHVNFLLCKYDRSILITCPKCLIKLYYPANHKLANRKLLPQNVTNYGLNLNKESNHSCSFPWVR